MVLVTASLFLTGFAHDDTEKVATLAWPGQLRDGPLADLLG